MVNGQPMTVHRLPVYRFTGLPADSGRLLKICLQYLSQFLIEVYVRVAYNWKLSIITSLKINKSLAF
jgi:hypothetical protein